MKPTSALLFLLTGLFVSSISCKKDSPNINTTEVRLIAIERRAENGDIYRYDIGYNANGQIEKIIYGQPNVQPLTIFTITYNGNEAILARPASTMNKSIHTDTIRLFMAPDQRLVKRIQTTRSYYNPPDFLEQRTYVYDTTTYTYDPNGLLKQTVCKKLDSTWFVPDLPQITTIRTTGITDYTVQDGNIVKAHYVQTDTSITKKGSKVYDNITSQVLATTYGYTKGFPNKTDFQNAAILNETELFFELPLNRMQTHLPDKSTFSLVEKDGNGNITSQQNYALQQSLSYNAYGFVSTQTRPEVKTTFIYNK